MFEIEVCEGKRVRNPDDVNKLPLVEGKVYRVPASQYWMRRILAKEVKLVDKSKCKEEPQKVEEEKKEVSKRGRKGQK